MSSLKAGHTMSEKHRNGLGTCSGRLKAVVGVDLLSARVVTERPHYDVIEGAVTSALCVASSRPALYSDVQ